MPEAPKFYTKNYLPSKKILAIIGVLVFAGIVYAVAPRAIDYYQTHRAKFSFSGKPPEPIIVASETTDGLDRDTDSDGILDWQETLFGLDPKKPDSNADGVPDKLPTANGVPISDFVDVSDFGKLTLSVYGAFQTTPTETITEDQVSEQVGNQVLTHAQTVEAGLKKYTSIDLELIDSDKNSILAYEAGIKKMIDDVPDGALLAKNIQEHILKGTDAAGSDSIFLNQTITKLLAMPVPARMKDLHLSMVNAPYYIIQVLQMPPSTDELTTYTKSLIVQKNINLVMQTVGDIVTIANVYRATP